jgi:hypothetical protein
MGKGRVGWIAIVVFNTWLRPGTGNGVDVGSYNRHGSGDPDALANRLALCGLCGL